MFHQPSSGLHQPLLQAGQGPVLNPSRQTQPPPQIPQVVGQQAQRQPHLVRAEPMAREPRHLDRLLSLLDPLLRRPPLVIEPHHRPARRLHGGHDETQPRGQLPSMVLHLRHYSACGLPTGGLVEKALVPHDGFVTRPPHRAREQFLDVPQQVVVRGKPNRVFHPALFQRFVDLRAEFVLLSKPHEYWRWLDHTTTYTEFKKEMWDKAGPLTQGPYLSQALRLLEGFDLKKMGFNSAGYIHTVIEAEKLALADRDEYYGDPNFVKVPMQQLLSDQYTEMRRKLIDPKKASLELRPGDPYNMKPTKPPTITGPWHGGTTVMCVTDKFGNVIAATPSGLSSTAGVAGRTGIIHGSRLSSLNTFVGTPDVIQPGKRPRITLSPTLLFHDNQPVMAISVAGGDQQDQAAIQVILNYVEFGMSPEEAFKAPRFSTTHFISSFGQDRASLGSLSVPNTLPEAVQADLRARGHVVTASRGGVGGVALIGIDPKTKQATGVGPAAGKME